MSDSDDAGPSKSGLVTVRSVRLPPNRPIAIFVDGDAFPHARLQLDVQGAVGAARPALVQAMPELGNSSFRFRQYAQAGRRLTAKRRVVASDEATTALVDCLPLWRCVTELYLPDHYVPHNAKGMWGGAPVCHDDQCLNRPRPNLPPRRMYMQAAPIPSGYKQITNCRVLALVIVLDRKGSSVPTPVPTSHARDIMGRTALHDALANSHDPAAVVPILLDLIAHGCNPAATDWRGWTIVHHAAERGLNLVVERLLPALPLSAFDAPDRQGHTPLLLALRRGHVHLAPVLLGAGASLRTADRDGVTARMWLERLTGGVVEAAQHDLARVEQTLDLIDSFNMFTELGMTPLHAAAHAGRHDVIASLLTHDHMRQVIDAADNSGCTPLHVAARRGHVTCIAALLAHSPRPNLDGRDACGRTPLHLAVLHRHTTAAQTLLRAGSPVDTFDCQQMAPLHAAAAMRTRKGLEMVAALLAAGADPNLRAVTEAQTRVLTLLKARPPNAAPEPPKSPGRRPLPQIRPRGTATSREGREPPTPRARRVSRFHVGCAPRQRGDALNSQGPLPAEVAVRAGNEAAVRALLNAGAAAGATHGDLPETLFELACALGCDTIARLLATQGGAAALIKASERLPSWASTVRRRGLAGDVAFFQMLRGCNIPRGKEECVAAAEAGHTTLLRLLLRDRENLAHLQAVLEVAAQCNHIDCVDLVLDTADENTRALLRLWSLAVSRAARAGHVIVVGRLLAEGFPAGGPSDALLEEHPVTAALTHGHVSVAELLMGERGVTFHDDQLLNKSECGELVLRAAVLGCSSVVAGLLARRVPLPTTSDPQRRLMDAVCRHNMVNAARVLIKEPALAARCVMAAVRWRRLTILAMCVAQPVTDTQAMSNAVPTMPATARDGASREGTCAVDVMVLARLYAYALQMTMLVSIEGCVWCNPQTPGAPSAISFTTAILACHGASQAVVCALLESGAIRDNFADCLEVAAGRGDVAIIDCLLERAFLFPARECNALAYAVVKKHWTVCDHLLTRSTPAWRRVLLHGRAPLNVPPKASCRVTALQGAAALGHVPTLEALINAGVEAHAEADGELHLFATGGWRATPSATVDDAASSPRAVVDASWDAVGRGADRTLSFLQHLEGAVAALPDATRRGWLGDAGWRETEAQQQRVIKLCVSAGRPVVWLVPHALSHGTASALHLALMCAPRAPAASRQLRDRGAAYERVVLMLLQQGVNINQRDAFGRMPITVAAQLGLWRVVDRMLDMGAPADVSLPTSRQSPLHFAVLAGETATVARLLACQASTVKPDAQGRAPLHYAGQRRSSRAVCALVLRAALRENEGADAVGDVVRGVGAWWGSLCIAEAVASRDAVAGAITACEDWWAVALEKAVASGHEAAVGAIVPLAPSAWRTHTQRGSGMPLVYSAVAAGHERVALVLLELGSDAMAIAFRNPAGENAVHLACARGMRGLVHTLTAAITPDDAPPHESEPDAVTRAIRQQLDAAVAVAPKLRVRESLAQQLVQQSLVGLTPAQYAVSFGHHAMARMLGDVPSLGAAADLVPCGWKRALMEQPNAEGTRDVQVGGLAWRAQWTPKLDTLVRCARVGGLEIVVSLLPRTNDINEVLGVALLHAMTVAQAELLVGHGADADFKAYNEARSTPLLSAVARGREELALWLLQHGGDPHHTNDAAFGCDSVLHVAAREGLLRAVQQLLRRGADVNYLNKYEDTPFDCALAMGHVSVLVVLAAHGGHPGRSGGRFVPARVFHETEVAVQGQSALFAAKMSRLVTLVRKRPVPHRPLTHATAAYRREAQPRWEDAAGLMALGPPWRLTPGDCALVFALPHRAAPPTGELTEGSVRALLGRFHGLVQERFGVALTVEVDAASMRALRPTPRASAGHVLDSSLVLHRVTRLLEVLARTDDLRGGLGQIAGYKLAFAGNEQTAGVQLARRPAGLFIEDTVFLSPAGYVSAGDLAPVVLRALEGIERVDHTLLLPPELLHAVFSHLSSYDLMVCAQVSRAWCVAARDPVLWARRRGRTEGQPWRGVLTPPPEELWRRRARLERGFRPPMTPHDYDERKDTLIEHLRRDRHWRRF